MASDYCIVKKAFGVAMFLFGDPKCFRFSPLHLSPLLSVWGCAFFLYISLSESWLLVAVFDIAIYCLLSVCVSHAFLSVQT